MWRGLAVLAVLAGVMATRPAEAALKLCNRTSYILYAATAEVTGGGSTARGWVRVAPGDCQTALPEKLKPQSYLVYARSALTYSGPGRAWGGDVPLCAKDGPFSLRQKTITPTCTGDVFALPFASLDTHGRPDWTMTFDDDPRLASLEAAQLAGVKRLLRENGYAIAAIDGKPDNATGAALADFRKKMRFAERDGNDRLFTALESEAGKHGGAPEGFTVCNDTKANLAAAVGEAAGTEFVARGWWRIAGGACARMITTALKEDAVWLSAQKPGGGAVVSGADSFCVAPQEFEIKGRDDCVARGLAAQGFARIDVHGKSGVLVRVGASGLGPPQAGMSK